MTYISLHGNGCSDLFFEILLRVDEAYLLEFATIRLSTSVLTATGQVTEFSMRNALEQPTDDFFMTAAGGTLERELQITAPF